MTEHIASLKRNGPLVEQFERLWLSSMLEE